MKPTRINAILHELADGILIIFSLGPAVETYKSLNKIRIVNHLM